MLDLLAALGLALVLEGALMALAPGKVREGALAIAALGASSLRGAGFAAALVGLGLVWLARGG